MGASLVHIGMTVTDIEKTSGFYIKHFGFRKDYGSLFDEGFFEEHHSVFRQPAGISMEMQMIRSANGIMIELFRFSNAEDGGDIEWQRTGYNHITLRVDDLPKAYERMKEDGIEFLTPLLERSRGDGHWLYLKDPDGNVVELWD